jgi:MIP family channel proteins
MPTDDLRRAFAEFAGTFGVVFAAIGGLLALPVILGASFNPSVQPQLAVLGLVGAALAYGLAYAVMASAVGHISGGHFNPAVTLGFFVTQRIAPLLAALYWVAQFAGGIAAAALWRWFAPKLVRDVTHLAAPSLGSGITHWQALVLEAVLTFFLVWVVFASTADPRGTFRTVAGLAIGLTITVDVLIGGPLSGAAINPARALGSELIQNHWSRAWIWYAGPFAGGGIAALLYDWLYLRPAPRPLPVGFVESGVAEPGPGESASAI